MQEISVIKDDTDKVCYMLPLDTEKIPQPQGFLDIIYGLQVLYSTSITFIST